MSTPKLTAEELAPLLEVEKRKIYRLVASGKLTAVRDLAGRLYFNPAKVRQDYAAAGVPLPDTFAAYLRKPWDTSRPRAETRGAA